MTDAFEVKESTHVQTTILQHDDTKAIVYWEDRKQFIRYRHTLEVQLFKHPKYKSVQTILHKIGNLLIDHKEREEE